MNSAYGKDPFGDFDPDSFANAKMIIQAELDTFEKTKHIPDPEAPESGKVIEVENTHRYYNVIPRDRMKDFQREWKKSLGMRMLIRAAGQLPFEEAIKTKTIAGLYEMSKSNEWIYDPCGKLPIPEFHMLFALTDPTYRPQRKEFVDRREEKVERKVFVEKMQLVKRMIKDG